MSDINECFSSFLAQMRKGADINFVKTDMEYQELECYLTANMDRYEAIISMIDSNDQAFLRDYIGKRNYQISCVDDTLYMAGYMDCIQLLKALHIL